MSSQFDVHIGNCQIGALGTLFYPLFKVPVEGGGITLIHAHLHCYTAATFTPQLVTLGTAGTAVDTSGTFGTLSPASGTFAAGGREDFTISDAYIGPGTWVGIQTTAGTAVTQTSLDYAYIMGK